MASATHSSKTHGTHVRMVDLIAGKRDGKEHSKAEIDFIVAGVMDGSVPDYQLSAWLMAVCWRGLTDAEAALYTDVSATHIENGNLVTQPDLHRHVKRNPRGAPSLI